MSPSHPPVDLFYPKYDLAMLLWCSLSGGLPAYSRDVLFTAFSVVQHNMTQHDSSLYISKLLVLPPYTNVQWHTTIFIDQTQHQKEKVKLGESKIHDL